MTQHANQPELTLITGGADNDEGFNLLAKLEAARAEGKKKDQAKKEAEIGLIEAELNTSFDQVCEFNRQIEAKRVEIRQSATLAAKWAREDGEGSNAVKMTREVMAREEAKLQELIAQRDELAAKRVELEARKADLEGKKSMPPVSETATAAPAVSAAGNAYRSRLPLAEQEKLYRYVELLAAGDPGIQPLVDRGPDTCWAPAHVGCCNKVELQWMAFSLQGGAIVTFCREFVTAMGTINNEKYDGEHNSLKFSKDREKVEQILKNELAFMNIGFIEESKESKKPSGPTFEPKSDAKRRAELAYKKALIAAIVAILEPTFAEGSAKLAEKIVKKFDDDGTPDKPSTAKDVVLKAVYGRFIAAESAKNEHDREVEQIIGYRLALCLGLSRSDINGMVTRELTRLTVLGDAGHKPSCEPVRTAPTKKPDGQKKGKKGGGQGSGQKNGPDQDARRAAKHAAKHGH